MPKLNIAQTKRRLNGFCVLIMDEKHAKCLRISEKTIHEEDTLSPPPVFEDRAGYFKGTSGGGIANEQNVFKEFKKRFYKSIIAKASKDYRAGKFEKLIIMCPTEDVALIQKLLTTDLEKVLIGFKEGNYIKVIMNEVLKKVLEVF